MELEKEYDVVDLIHTYIQPISQSISQPTHSASPANNEKRHLLQRTLRLHHLVRMQPHLQTHRPVTHTRIVRLASPDGRYPGVRVAAVVVRPHALLADGAAVGALLRG